MKNFVYYTPELRMTVETPDLRNLGKVMRADLLLGSILRLPTCGDLLKQGQIAMVKTGKLAKIEFTDR
jgi:hypothetical protein